jgi:hypothetical protein
MLDGTATLPATVVAIEDETLRAKFDSLNLQETEALTMILYSRADTWLGPRKARERDHPMRSLGHILRLSLYGLAQTVGSLMGNLCRSNKKTAAKSGMATSVIPVLLLAVLAGASARDARGAQAAGADFHASIVEHSQSSAEGERAARHSVRLLPDRKRQHHGGEDPVAGAADDRPLGGSRPDIARSDDLLLRDGGADVGDGAAARARPLAGHRLGKVCTSVRDSLDG